MAERSLVLPAQQDCCQQDFTLMVLSSLSASERPSCCTPDAIFVLPAGQQNGHQSNIQIFHPSHRDANLIEVKYCDDTATEPGQQLSRVTK